MDYQDTTPKEKEFRSLSEAMPFVKDNESAIEMIFMIQKYRYEYPSYYRVTQLKTKFLRHLDNLERLDQIFDL